MNRIKAEELASLVMRRLTIYNIACGDLTDEMNAPDPDILQDLTDLLEGR